MLLQSVWQAMFIFEASMVPWGRNCRKTNSFLKDYVNLFFQIFGVKQFQQFFH